MNLLAIQLKRIGDLILTTAALQGLKDADGGDRVKLTLALTDNTAPLLPAMGDFVDEAIIYRRGRLDPAFWRRLANPRQRWDACLDFTGTDRSALAAVASGAPRRRIARDALERKPFWRRYCYSEFIETPVRRRHTTDRFLDVTAGFALAGSQNGEPASPSLRVPADARDRARRALASAGLAGGAPYVVIHPGSARSEKYWRPEGWAEVIRYCHEELGTACVLTGGRGNPFEDAHLARIRSGCGKVMPLDLTGRLDLLALASVIHGAALYAGVDSGPMHLAAAMRRPTVALFGPTDPFVWRPRHAPCWILQAGNPQCPVTQFQPMLPEQPMELIQEEAVLGCIESAFRSQRSSDMIEQ